MDHADTCTECGTCLMQCPEAAYDLHRAVEEIRALRRGEQAPILSSCITCMACDEFCSARARPFERISRLQERYGIGLVSRQQADMIETKLANVPVRIVEGDAALPVLSLCVMEHALPADMGTSALFAGMTIVSGSPYYSRVVHLHTGLPSLAEQHAAAFIGSLAALGRREVVFAHDDCYVMAAVLAPSWGIEVPFRPVHLAEWLGRVMKRRKKELRTLNKKMAFQRPCISRKAPWTDESVNTVFELAGVQRVRRAYDGMHARCCGIGLAEYYPEKSASMVQGHIDDAVRHEAEAMVFGCPSCQAFMASACREAGLAPVFIADIARTALGELPAGCPGAAEARHHAV